MHAIALSHAHTLCMHANALSHTLSLWMHVLVLSYVHTLYMHAIALTYTHTHAHTHTHARTYTHTHIHTYTHIHTNTRTHTHTQATVHPWICYVSMNLLWQQSHADTRKLRTHNIFMSAQQSNGDTTILPRHTGWSTRVTPACLGYPVPVSNKNLTLTTDSWRHRRVMEVRLNQRDTTESARHT